ncbi:MAG: DUF512 domain-containing protein [Ruminococcaceae bacterium]|nr:DUF512 domain-containing protein [Oscillospiraceae bacterium]
MAVTIERVEKGSAAQKAGLRAGMRLVAINGHPICDGLDYEFYTTAAHLKMEALDEAGQPQTFIVNKAEYEPLGCGFASYLIDAQHPCKNRCVFCFIDQMPGGMRPSLYFKDDDERLGFLFGNYITLTNLSEREVARIITMRFSPVNISVHTANPALRVQMMGNPRAGQALEIIPRLAAAGIAMNFQLVLCPGLNDGPELEHTLDWLTGFGSAVQSIAAVPVGLTRYREGLAQLRGYTQAEAAAQLDILLRAGDKLLAAGGSRRVYPSDEWFILAGRDIPPGDFYEDYPQLENGVGMWRLLLDEFSDAVDDAPGGPQAVEADMAVGEMAAPLGALLAEKLREKYPNAQLWVHPVRNNFFGGNVWVSGLLTGADMAAQLRGNLHSGVLLIPEDALRAEGDVLLDDLSPAQLGEKLGAEVRVAPRDGAALLKAILACGLPEGE